MSDGTRDSKPKFEGGLGASSRLASGSELVDGCEPSTSEVGSKGPLTSFPVMLRNLTSVRIRYLTSQRVCQRVSSPGLVEDLLNGDFRARFPNPILYGTSSSAGPAEVNCGA